MSGPVDLDALAPMDVAGRVGRLVERFDGLGIDALVVTHLTNIRYLTGFTGSAATVVVTAAGAVTLVTDGRYADQAPVELRRCGVDAAVEVSSDRQRERVVGALGDAARVGLEAEHVSWARSRTLADEWLAGRSVVATADAVEALRIVKDAGEVDRIRAAAAVADAALAAVRPLLAERPTEREFGLALDGEIRRLGASGTSFETIVASGPNGALPHARPSSRRISDGDLVVLDFGAVVDGYCSDMTRTVAVGEPSEVQRRMLSVVLDAQRAGVEAVAAGVETSEVDRACREVIAAAGWSDAFTHGTGHGVGLDVHEAPRVASTAAATLAAGHVVTVEPGVYLGDHGGVRIEDTVVVTGDGCVPLTLTPKTTTVA